MNKNKLKIGGKYLYAPPYARGETEIEKSRVITCIEIYKHFARFDFGKYKQSLIWWNVENYLQESRKGR